MMNHTTSHTATSAAARPVPIGELLDAWLALQRGAFRRNSTHPHPATTVADAVSHWLPAPGEAPVIVVGCGGGAGASTLALLLAEASGTGRVVECAPACRSGLAGASTAELGDAEAGWVQGRRGGVLIQRRADQPPGPGRLPAPLPGLPGAVSVVDAGWSLRELLDSTGWLSDLARTCPLVVLVARCSVPSAARLEADLGQLETDRCWVVLTGHGQLPRPVEHALGTRTRHLRRVDRVHLLPHDARLAMAGITTEPMPRGFDRTARTLLKGLLP